MKYCGNLTEGFGGRWPELACRNKPIQFNHTNTTQAIPGKWAAWWAT